MQFITQTMINIVRFFMISAFELTNTYIQYLVQDQDAVHGLTIGKNRVGRIDLEIIIPS